MLSRYNSGVFDSTRISNDSSVHSPQDAIALSKDKKLLKLIRNTLGTTYRMAPSWINKQWARWAKDKINSMDRALTSQSGWYHYVFEDLIDISIRGSKIGIYEVVVRQRIGKMVLHYGVLKPKKIDPLKLKIQISKLAQLWDRLKISIGQVKADRLIHKFERFLMHPHWLARSGRQAADLPFFLMFHPYVLAYDFLIKRNTFRTYPWYRKGITSIWLAYILFELLAYTPVSDWYSEQGSLEEALYRFFFERNWDTDSYAINAIKQFEDDGITVVWIAFENNRFYNPIWQDMFLSLQQLKFSGWNSVYVILGEPEDPDLWNQYQVITQKPIYPYGGEVEEVDIGTVWADQEGKIFRYVPKFVDQAESQTQLFKAVLWMINQKRCELNPEQNCNIQNLLLHSHGRVGELIHIFHHTPLLNEMKFVVGEQAGNQGPAYSKAVNTLDTAAFQSFIHERPQIILLACDYAKDEEGKLAMHKLASLFDLENKHGRLVANTRTVVVPLTIIPMFLNGTQVERQSINAWSSWDIFKGYLMFGPNIVSHYSRGDIERYGQDEPPVFTLDYSQQ